MWKVAFCLLVVGVAVSVAQEKPERVEPDVASRNLTKKVEPTVPPLAKAVGVGGAVVLDIVIDQSGKVSSVTLLSGHPMLAPAFIETVKKWEYTPFLKEGHPISVLTRVEWNVVSPKYSQAQEKALHDYYPAFQTCYQLVKQGKGAEAETKCRETVALSDQLPDNRVLERSDSRVFLGHALYSQHKFLESIPLYEKAVEIRKPYEKSDRDADFASENASLARAYASVGRLPEADTLYSQAVVIYKAAIVNLPEMKSNYTVRLKSTLLEYAKLKAALGQNDEASRLDAEASQL
ncbi:MAG TPA: TonB family protein [Candidatus Sulfotelmatobacter sp.]|nr:TonB family protein [Candidatus Sulfotelmatobacter sp.]